MVEANKYEVVIDLDGEINKVLRKYMCSVNAAEKHELNEIGTDYANGPPSNIRWRLLVLPKLAKLLYEEYGTRHAVDPWVLGVLSGDLIKYVDEAQYELSHQ